ncbi:PLP-dependent aminotransferase family protein [Pseudonocardia acaciae]|uniref:aminotransferase-like domain-containing protein n=1 Tax=Pseudonocardia acaciae TaxID=551276 RepID=UPI00048CE792|nr:PLP-dependent aminotransferase family protein [Pseudonocardia acaciae]
MSDYHEIADALAADIAEGRLRPGQRLPPQRRFARGRGIANSTAARVYGELVRRGLAVGEVGRGTFVRASTATASGGAATAPARRPDGRAVVDLELSFPVLPEQAQLLADGLGPMLDPSALADGLRPVGPDGIPAAREAAAALLTRSAWTPDPSRLLFAGNGRQAIAAAIATLLPAGGRLGVEPMTYPVVKGIAARLGVTLVPLTMDEHGLVPSSLADAPVRAVYLQPALHNPLGATIPDQRRIELADVLRRRGLYAIEDTVYGFLGPDLAPLSAHAPERTILIDSLSKRLAPGLTLGFLVPPPEMVDAVTAALRSGTWTAAGFVLATAARWMADGSVATIAAAKRADALARQQVASERLAEFDFRADPRAYHGWWELPDPWRADTFVAAAARRGIAVTPGAAFAVTPGQAPNAVRLALAAPPLDVLTTALDTLASLARRNPDELGVE